MSTVGNRAVRHTHISSKAGPFDLKLGEVWHSRSLIWLFTKRSFVVTYKQTILGPLWLFLVPLITSGAYVLLFGNIAKLSTDGVPQLLFYLTGTALWTYFSGCVTSCAGTFIGNAGLFGKVYFPRLTVPLSDVLGNALRLMIQMILVAVLLIYYVMRGMVSPNPIAFLLIPLVVIQLGIMGMGLGLVISSMTTRYRDLQVLVSFGMSLWMYATPVVYPLSTLSGILRKILLINPVTAPAELFRYAITGAGGVPAADIIWSLGFTAAAAVIGIAVFNRVERTFIDTV